jgi:hypothetical protein
VERRFSLAGGIQYPVNMELRYKTGGRTPRVGMGQTRRMSSNEVVFVADQALEQGTRLEISIAWPALLNERVALQLVVEGDIVGRRDSLITARIRKYHFRTRGRQSELAHVQTTMYPTQPAGPRVQYAACAS